MDRIMDRIMDRTMDRTMDRLNAPIAMKRDMPA